jgi:hypothetical protein
MPTDFPIPEFPEKYAAKIHEIAVKNGISDEEVVVELLNTFFEVVDRPQEEDDSDVMRRLRCAFREKFGSEPE